MSFDAFTLTGIAVSVALICATVSMYKKHHIYKKQMDED